MQAYTTETFELNLFEGFCCIYRRVPFLNILKKNLLEYFNSICYDTLRIISIVFYSKSINITLC
jgi:hypothetical protein